MRTPGRPTARAPDAGARAARFLTVLTVGLASVVVLACASVPDGEEDGGEAGESAESGAADVGATVQAEILLRTTRSGISSPRTQVLRDAESLRRVWRDIAAAAGEDSVPPRVDFGESIVVVAALGRRNTGGYGIEVEEVTRTEEGLRVHLLQTGPGPRCSVPQVLTTPAVVARVAARHASVEFVRRTEQMEC